MLTLICLALFSQAQNVQTTSSPAKTVEQLTKENEQLLRTKNDWPNFSRYREANEKLGLPVANEERVVFMGNSITDGWIGISPEFFKGKPYVDRGISGQTTPQMLVRFRADVINLKPKVVLILALEIYFRYAERFGKRGGGELGSFHSLFHVTCKG